MSAAHDIEALLVRLGSSNKPKVTPGDHSGIPHRPPLGLSWPGLEEVLPDGGLPQGVVELASPKALGGSTSIALATVRAGQARSGSAWCAWIDPERTLHAPGVVAAGVDIARLLIVSPSRALLGRAAVKVVSSGAFEVVVVDYDAIPGACRERTENRLQAPGSRLQEIPRSSLDPGARSPKPDRAGGGKRKAWAPEVLVRKLALASECSAATVLLLTDATRPRAVPWPVALRLELSRPNRNELSVRVTKDRRGRSGLAKTVPFRPTMRASG
jgi:hypothetical protein